jgi:NhaP-type Na+/H+ or K+/H+ antiporter
MSIIVAPPVRQPAVAAGWHLGHLYTLGLVAVGAAVLVGAVAMTRQERSGFSPSIVYVALGAGGAVALSLLDVAPIDPQDDHVLVERLTELALIVAVFPAGLTIEREVRRRSWASIATLLTVVRR